MTGTLLSFGHGYSAKALARRLLPQGWTVIGTTRSTDKAERMRAAGIQTIVWPGDAADSGEIIEALDQATHLLTSVSPTEQGDPVLNALGPAIQKKASSLTWAGYLSTTGVYGDHQGGWVDESTPLTPSTERGKMRAQAEAAWQSIPDLPLHIFRLAGIYGPNRGPFAKVQKGTARRIIKDGQVFSRIHVADIAQTLQASIQNPNPGGIYNLCDDDPAPPQDVIAFAAQLLGQPIPPEIPYDAAEMTPMARSFYAESKRVKNDRIKSELGIELMFPTYRAGLAAMLDRLQKAARKAQSQQRPN